MPDGIFLSPVSGLHYVIHLFDQTQIALEAVGATSDVQLVQVREAVRVHDDRLAYLEHNHGDVKKRVSLKVAADSEFNDWLTNRSEEDWLNIRGLKRVSGDLSSRDWQVSVQRQVTEFLRQVLKVHRVNLDFKVLYVQNPVRGRNTGVPVLNVQLNSVQASRCLRDLYSGFFRRNNPAQLPPGFKGVSVRNKVTLATRIRIEILKQLGSNYKESNPGSSFDVRGYEPRPRLITTPARGTSARPRTYTFMDAVTLLPPVLSDEALTRIFQVIGQHFPGELRELFVIINDDDRARCESLVRNQVRSRGQHSAGPNSVTFGNLGSTGTGPSAASTFSGNFASSGAGMELEAGFLSSIRAPPPPPPGSPPSSPARAATRQRGEAPTRSPSREHRSGKSGRSPSRSSSREHRSGKSGKSGKSGRSRKSKKSRKSAKSKSKKSSKSGKASRSDKRGFKRSRHTPPPGEKSRKKARHRTSPSTSSGSSEDSGSGTDTSSTSGSSSSSSSSRQSQKRDDSHEH